MSRNKEGLDFEARCLPSKRYSDDWGCSLDQQGNPWRVGYRICKHSDCIQPRHITQSPYIAKKIYGYLPDLKRRFRALPAEAQLLEKLAKPVDKFNPPSRCKVPGCKRKHRALNLCNAHHAQHYRLRLEKGKPKRVKRDNSEIDQYARPAAGNALKAKDRYCHYPDCTMDYFARGLCKVHHKRWLRWKQGNVKRSS